MLNRANFLRFGMLLVVILFAEFCITGCFGTAQQKQVKKECYSRCVPQAVATCVVTCMATNAKPKATPAETAKQKAICYGICAAREGFNCIQKCSFEQPAKIE